MLALFLLAWIVQMYYYLYVFRPFLLQLPICNSKQPTNRDEGVSVIICAKNEAHNLVANLGSILTQDYPNFEVIVVDDNSIDNTTNILADFAAQYSHLRILSTKNFDSKAQGKKKALTNGIMFAAYDIVLLTDADCYANSDQWLRLMAAPFVRPEIEIVLGVSPYLPTATSHWLNTIIQYETAYTALQYLSFAHGGFAYMGVGRNLAYRKKLFYEQIGFQTHQHITSGDDDLFIGTAATATNTTWVASSKAICLTQPPLTWQAWVRQKKRHLSTARHYRLSHQIRLALLSGSHLWLYLSAIISLLTLPTSQLGLITILLYLRYGFQLWYFPRLTVLQMQLTARQYVLADVAFVGYYVFFLPILIANQSPKWK